MSPRGGSSRGLVAGAVGTAVGWLVEPAAPADSVPYPVMTPGEGLLAERVLVAVVGLGSGRGATTVARALGAELALRDPGGACAVTCAGPGRAPALALPAAGRLARRLGPATRGRTRACGRLCLVECEDAAAMAGAALYLTPLVIDVTESADAAVAASVADRVVLVGDPRTEPALGAAVAESLARVGSVPLMVLNRGPAEDAAWRGRGAVVLPESRLGALLAGAGREPCGELGRAVAALADLVTEGPE